MSSNLHANDPSYTVRASQTSQKKSRVVMNRKGGGGQRLDKSKKQIEQDDNLPTVSIDVSNSHMMSNRDQDQSYRI